MHRFYVPESFASEFVDLAGDEGAHLARVLRLRAGDQVALFDGRGGSAVAEVESVQKRTARLRVVERLPIVQRAGPQLTLITAVPKSDRFRWLVEKATELGVQRLIPVRTERSVVHPGDGKLQRMEAAVIAACKQCGRNDLLQIEPLKDWSDALRANGTWRLLVADPQGRPIREISRGTGTCNEIAIAIGPEGGLTPQELELAGHAGAELIQLGPTILRIETAALAFAAWIGLAAFR